MGQKVNPTCLRLHPKNKHFDSCWFSEKQYAHSIYKDLDIEIYYNAILKQIQYPSALSFLEASPRKRQISFLFLNPAQLREQSFKQLNNVNASGRDKKRKQNALFNTRKETTSQYGLLEKRGEFLGLLSPYFFTAAFLQDFKKKGSIFSLKKNSKNALFSLKKETQNEKTPRESSEKTGARWMRHLQLKRGVCSSMLGLAISQYFVQRNLSGNFLSATSRFLLLQVFSSLLNKKGNSHQIFGGFPQKEKEFAPDMGLFSLEKEKRPRNLVKNNKEKNNHQQDAHLHAVHGGRLYPQDRGRLFASQRGMEERRNNDGLLYAPHGGDPFKEKLWLGDHSEPSRFINQINKQESDLFFKLQKSSIYTYHIESIISNRLKSSCKISLFRAQNVAQNALFIAEEIVYQLQRRNTFRQIKIKFLQELANKPTIKGVRVTCVGRIGGRAKKAQRARGESFKMGQTSLHLFDSKVSFASKTALTPYGAVGVKVWVCWK